MILPVKDIHRPLKILHLFRKLLCTLSPSQHQLRLLFQNTIQYYGLLREHLLAKGPKHDLMERLKHQRRIGQRRNRNYRG